MTDNNAAALVARLDSRLAAMHEDLAEIKKQVTRTNGRVNELEVAARIEMALAAERAGKLARESENRADRLNTEVAKSERRQGRKQWAVNAAIAFAGVVTTVLGIVLTR